MRTSILLVLAMCVAVLPGCVAWEIRDEIRGANAKLDSVQSTLGQTNERLNSVEDKLTRLETTNALLGNVEQGLGRIDSTNSSLSTLEQQLAVLNSINTSLQRLDSHLASLRGTIGRIDSVMPFLDLGGGPVDVPPAPPANAEGSPEGSPADGGTPGGQAAPARRDPLLGAWVSVYPDGTMALVFFTDGKLVYAAQGLGAHDWTWRRDGANLVLVEPARQAQDLNGEVTTIPARERTFVVEAVAARSLVLREGNVLRMFSRP
ncbi:MAG: hypothetical protein SFY69_10890 [Planctomycetota bacterium]|nr:hypothetical protein [Planctomycetota bacterium]